MAEPTGTTTGPVAPDQAPAAPTPVSTGGTAPAATGPAGVSGQTGDGQRATDEAKKRLQSADFQKLLRDNPIMALLMLLIGMANGGFGKDMLGGDFSKFIGKTFGVDNPDGLIRSVVTPPASIGTIPVGERQQAVSAVIPDAAKAAGISPELMRGVWGIESGFGSHKTLVSSTGCSGDFQFCDATFNDMIKKHGAEIARLAGDKLTPEIKEALNAGKWNVKTQWGSDLRFHPAVSAYASAFYLKEVADGLHVDPNKQENFGVIYAGYNVGPGNAGKLLGMQGTSGPAGTALGSAATYNPMFYTGDADASTALARYQSYVMARVVDYHKNFDTAPAPTQTANAGTSSDFVKDTSQTIKPDFVSAGTSPPKPQQTAQAAPPKDPAKPDSPVPRSA